MAAGSPEHLHTFPLAPPHRPRAQPTANGSNGGATCGAVVTYSHAIRAGRKYSVFPFPYALGKMAPGRWVTMFFALSLSVRLTAALEPFTTSAVLIGAASTAYYYFSCRFQECCTKAWVPLDVKGLETSLKEQLFGQHIALDVIPKAIEGFLSNKDAKKPLTLSLHGWTGTGKSFVSRIIAESLYKNGMDSKYVHKFVTSYHFPNVQHTSKYIQQLQDWIRGNVSLCKRSLFIFDEMDKMNPELIDSIKPFLEYYSHLDGVVYRKAMFIFLSNAGGEKINDIVLDFWQRGMKREDIQQKDLENSLSLEVYNNKNSGFWHTRLIDKYLIDYFIPFLPLEYKHVVLCAKAELYTRHLEDVDQVAIKVAEEMVYFPKDQRVFSVKGCKTVAAKVNYWTAADSKL